MNKERALIIEDEKEIREYLIYLFSTELGFKEVHSAEDGLDGFKKCSDFKYDVICTDHKMPFFTGADLLHAIRKKEGPNKTSSVIMISAFIPEINQIEDSSAKTFFLEKPIDTERLKKYAKLATL